MKIEIEIDINSMKIIPEEGIISAKEIKKAILETLNSAVTDSEIIVNRLNKWDKQDVNISLVDLIKNITERIAHNDAIGGCKNAKLSGLRHCIHFDIAMKIMELLAYDIDLSLDGYNGTITWKHL